MVTCYSSHRKRTRQPRKRKLSWAPFCRPGRGRHLSVGLSWQAWCLGSKPQARGSFCSSSMALSVHLGWCSADWLGFRCPLRLPALPPSTSLLSDCDAGRRALPAVLFLRACVCLAPGPDHNGLDVPSTSYMLGSESFPSPVPFILATLSQDRC